VDNVFKEIEKSIFEFVNSSSDFSALAPEKLIDISKNGEGREDFDDIISDAIKNPGIVESGTTGLDISRDGYSWKDSRGAQAGKDPVIDKAKTVLKKQAPEVFNALVHDGDNPDSVEDSDMVRGAAAGDQALSDLSVNVKVNNKRVGYVDTQKNAFIKETCI